MATAGAVHYSRVAPVIGVFWVLRASLYPGVQLKQRIPGRVSKKSGCPCLGSCCNAATICPLHCRSMEVAIAEVSYQEVLLQRGIASHFTLAKHGASLLWMGTEVLMTNSASHTLLPPYNLLQAFILCLPLLPVLDPNAFCASTVIFETSFLSVLD